MARPWPRAVHSTQDAAAALRDLAGDATYRELLERHPQVTRSLGAWHGWLTGRRDPRLSSFLDTVDALGGEVVIRRKPRNPEVRKEPGRCRPGRK